MINKELLMEYINSKSNTAKVVSLLDFNQNKVSYSGIIQKQNIHYLQGDGEEELVRAFLLTKLVNELGYKSGNIEIEHKYTAGRPHTNMSRIDIIVRDSKGNAFLFIELKKPDGYDSYTTIDKDAVIEEQLYKVAGMESTKGNEVKYLVLYTVVETCGKLVDECIIIDREKFQTFSEWVDSDRDCVNELPKNYGKAQKRPYIKSTDKDLETEFTHDALDRIQTDLHNVLWGGGGTDDNEVFASLTNLILAKIQDEDEKEDGDSYDFQSLTFVNSEDEEFETNETLFNRINSLYRRALESKLYITDETELAKSYVIDTKKFSLSKLKFTVQKLEGLSFVNGKNSIDGKDILGEFFEGIIRDGFKQNKGQFFTHINIVNFMLWAMQTDRLAIKRIRENKEIPYMIDPSAGSGTFLLAYMKFITQNIKYRFKDKLGTSKAVKDKIQTWFYPDNHEHIWAKDYLYANEFNFNLGTAIKVNMILHGDGSTNIFIKDGLLPFPKYIKKASYNALNGSIADELYDDMEVNEQFDLILTNPPFSVSLDNDTKKSLAKSFLFGSKKNSENLFIERWYQLLRENGRLAAVLPESVFDTTENKYIRLFLYKYFKIKAVVSLPQSTFEPYTSTKTSILFSQKKTKSEIMEWNNAWTKASNQYTYLKTRIENMIAVYDGKKEKASLPSIKNLTAHEEVILLRSMLNCYITKQDDTLCANELIEKYHGELLKLCTYDKDTKDVFGYVNTWWVFGSVASSLDYSVFMAEANNIGYKRTKRGEKTVPNDLYRTSDSGLVLVDDDVKDTILDYMREIEWD
ncbi:MAG: N-6 DNA methylase [Lachnoclostridium sp.]|jgi:type I restriction enzyme M protein|nr:N-6 DNA methylase [Lachnoclostridium sp.]